MTICKRPNFRPVYSITGIGILDACKNVDGTTIHRYQLSEGSQPFPYLSSLSEMEMKEPNYLVLTQQQERQEQKTHRPKYIRRQSPGCR